jgi:hypothetical protein
MSSATHACAKRLAGMRSAGASSISSSHEHIASPPFDTVAVWTEYLALNAVKQGGRDEAARFLS